MTPFAIGLAIATTTPTPAQPPPEVVTSVTSSAIAVACELPSGLARGVATALAISYAAADGGGSAAPATPAAPAPPPTPPPQSVSAVVEPGPRAVHAGLAVGAELGEPVSATAAWFAGKINAGVAIGTGTFYGPGLSIHVDGQYELLRVMSEMPVRAGVGLRYENQHYAAASVDELPQNRWGARASIAVAYQQPAWEGYAELAPGIDFKRSASCSYADGVTSICPHAQSTPAFVQFVVGARFFVMR